MWGGWAGGEGNLVRSRPEPMESDAISKWIVSELGCILRHLLVYRNCLMVCGKHHPPTPHNIGIASRTQKVHVYVSFCNNYRQDLLPEHQQFLFQSSGGGVNTCADTPGRTRSGNGLVACPPVPGASTVPWWGQSSFFCCFCFYLCHHSSLITLER